MFTTFFRLGTNKRSLPASGWKRARGAGAWVWGKAGRAETASSSTIPPLCKGSNASSAFFALTSLKFFQRPVFWYFCGAASDVGNLLIKHTLGYPTRGMCYEGFDCTYLKNAHKNARMSVKVMCPECLDKNTRLKVMCVECLDTLRKWPGSIRAARLYSAKIFACPMINVLLVHQVTQSLQYDYCLRTATFKKQKPNCSNLGKGHVRGVSGHSTHMTSLDFACWELYSANCPPGQSIPIW